MSQALSDARQLLEVIREMISVLFLFTTTMKINECKNLLLFLFEGER